jgi:DNA-binding NtrC family response regulator
VARIHSCPFFLRGGAQKDEVDVTGEIRSGHVCVTTNSDLVPNLTSGLRQLLIVEDDERFRKVVAECCKHWQFEVSTVADPIDAIDLLAKQPFDVVLTGNRMPGMTGLQLAKWVRRHCPDVPICIMSFEVNHPRFWCEVEGWVDAALAKPFGLDQLNAALLRAVDQRRKRYPSCLEMEPSLKRVLEDR